MIFWCFFGEQILDQPKIDALFNAFIGLNYTNTEFDSGGCFHELLLKFYDYMESNDYTSPHIAKATPEIEYNALIGYWRKVQL